MLKYIEKWGRIGADTDFPEMWEFQRIIASYAIFTQTIGLFKDKLVLGPNRECVKLFSSFAVCLNMSNR